MEVIVQTESIVPTKETARIALSALKRWIVLNGRTVPDTEEIDRLTVFPDILFSKRIYRVSSPITIGMALR
jgi:hypothetical protein